MTPPRTRARESGWISHNGLRINADMWLCDLDGAPVELTRSEFDLLLAIMQGARRVISKDTLALELRGEFPGGGGYVSDSDRRAVEVHMANLRRKLNDPVGSPRYIETVRGVGYRLAEAQDSVGSTNPIDTRHARTDFEGGPPLNPPCAGSRRSPAASGHAFQSIADPLRLRGHRRQQGRQAARWRSLDRRRITPTILASSFSPTIALVDSRLSSATWMVMSLPDSSSVVMARTRSSSRAR